MRSVVLLSILLVAACSGASPAPPAEPTPPAEPPAPPAAAPDPGDTFPTPYSAEQIRAATLPGRSYTWRIETGGKPAIERQIVFGSIDATGAELASDGEARRVTWEELRRHAEFPRAAVMTREETITVPAGTFDCVVYSWTAERRAKCRRSTSRGACPVRPCSFSSTRTAPAP